MLKFFYTGNYTDPIVESGEIHIEIRNAIRVYILADKYDVPILLKLAEKNFKLWLDLAFSHVDCLAAISDVYTLPGPTSVLKAATAECVRKKLKGMLQGSDADLVKTTLLQIPEFALDMLLEFVNYPIRGRCSNCGPDQAAEALQARCLKCGKGGVSFDYCR
jgi:hypothetical protein